MHATRPFYFDRQTALRGALFLALAVAFSLTCGAAYAANVTLDVAQQASLVSKQMNSLAKLAAFFGYIIGTFFAVKGLLAFRRFVDNPDEHPLNKALGYLVVSSLLIVLPYTIHIVWATFDAQSDWVVSTSGHFTDCGFGRNAC